MPGDDNSDKKEDDTSDGNAADKKTEGDDDKKSASTGDDGGDDGADTGDDRKMERIKKLSASKNKLETELQDLKDQNKMLAGLAADKKEDAPATDDDVLKEYDEAQLATIKKLVNKVGGLGEMQKEIGELKSMLKANKDDQDASADKVERKTVLKKYDGIVDSDELDEMITELNEDADPRIRVLAAAPYETIVRHFRGKEIAQREVDDAIDQKKRGGSGVPSGSGDKTPKPDETHWVYDPGDPIGSSEALDRELASRLLDE